MLMGILATLLGLATAASAEIQEAVVIDVRTAEEYQSGHVDGSHNIDFLGSDFVSKIQKLDKAKAYNVYCRSGNRSGQALKLMKSLGFERVHNLGSVAQAASRLKRSCGGQRC